MHPQSAEDVEKGKTEQDFSKVIHVDSHKPEWSTMRYHFVILMLLLDLGFLLRLLFFELLRKSLRPLDLLGHT